MTTTNKEIKRNRWLLLLQGLVVALNSFNAGLNWATGKYWLSFMPIVICLMFIGLMVLNLSDIRKIKRQQLLDELLKDEK